MGTSDIWVMSSTQSLPALSVQMQSQWHSLALKVSTSVLSRKLYGDSNPWLLSPPHFSL